MALDMGSRNEVDAHFRFSLLLSFPGGQGHTQEIWSFTSETKAK